MKHVLLTALPLVPSTPITMKISLLLVTHVCFLVRHAQLKLPVCPAESGIYQGQNVNSAHMEHMLVMEFVLIVLLVVLTAILLITVHLVMMGISCMIINVSPIPVYVNKMDTMYQGSNVIHASPLAPNAAPLPPTALNAYQGTYFLDMGNATPNVPLAPIVMTQIVMTVINTVKHALQQTHIVSVVKQAIICIWVICLV